MNVGYRAIIAKINAPSVSGWAGANETVNRIVGSRPGVHDDAKDRGYVVKKFAAEITEEPAQRIGFHFALPGSVPVIEGVFTKGPQLLQGKSDRTPKHHDAEESEHDSVETVGRGHVAQSLLRQIEHYRSSNFDLARIRDIDGLAKLHSGNSRFAPFRL